MNPDTTTIPIERVERQWRVTAAFFESAVGSSAALESLLARLYRREPVALAHAHRVSALAVRIGHELGLAARVLDDIERAALLHDVGRLVLPDPSGVPAGVLERSPIEHRSEQVQLAYEVVKDQPFLHPAATIVAASLECFDGSGVPLGLRGAEIPVGARVLHVADTLDALTSVCVSLACSSEVANAELVRLAGARFDPDVVAAWLRCSDEVPAALVPWWTQAERMN